MHFLGFPFLKGKKGKKRKKKKGILKAPTPDRATFGNIIYCSREPLVGESKISSGIDLKKNGNICATRYE